jgi:hypothetical protein
VGEREGGRARGRKSQGAFFAVLGHTPGPSARVSEEFAVVLAVGVGYTGLWLQRKHKRRGGAVVFVEVEEAPLTRFAATPYGSSHRGSRAPPQTSLWHVCVCPV